MNSSANAVQRGRFTAELPGEDVTVFLIGMRANKWWKIGKVFSVARSMPPMLSYLAANPESGVLGFHQWLGRTTIVMSYWKSPEHLQRFAADRDAPHLAPWRRFAKLMAGSGDVGVWHETYRVRASDLETVYSDMPPFGLGRATSTVPIGKGKNTARQRMGGKTGTSEK